MSKMLPGNRNSSISQSMMSAQVKNHSIIKSLVDNLLMEVCCLLRCLPLGRPKSGFGLMSLFMFGLLHD